MTSQWAVLQLREHSDPIPVSDLERDLLARWPQAVCRFPAVKQGVLDRDNPLSLYVFVKAPVSTKIEASLYAAHLLREPSSHRLYKVSDRELEEMVAPPALPPLGTLVRVTAGDWADMEGVVVAQNCTQVSVLLELWSKKAVVALLPNELVVL